MAKVIQQVAGPGNSVLTLHMWSQRKPTKTLALHTHGMQFPTDSMAVNHLVGTHKSYAFVVPFDRAMNNAGVVQDHSILPRFARALNDKKYTFRSPAPPKLAVYPYLFPIVGLDGALDALEKHGQCDTVSFADINPYPQAGYILLKDFLACPAPGKGKSFLEAYDNFLLLACRSNTATHQIGMGGAAPHYPDGLYTMDSRSVRHVVNNRSFESPF